MKIICLSFFISFFSFASEVKIQVLPNSSYQAAFSFEMSADKSSKKLTEIKINEKKFKVDGEWINSEDQVEIEAIDLNFDKKTDYAILIRRGVANRYILYLLWDNESNSFISLGELPELTLISKSNCWSGFEKGNESKAVMVKIHKNKFIKCP